ncbi:dephospho-CoA kinase [Aliarcobacter butzleri]|jgi:dephospho-CoA kinase|uniref:Dephospho-CoA kinase n=4 Tax=Aliarcobacter butzleri TaxID=28197 RepID=A8ER54_ALIB4|nr:dephospho-CoA kinase [Aliarcobacter butzleri]ABV66428.1 dephospho-CoA kinase [Aliarcobacter butzleri RM4018]AGR76477.1 dephospho-CoA kinase [Aliarcobacter butzleri 7h1h]EFU70973.1 dephospho-CoA kinase [Aliarcobacter butzleri JV22]KLD95826.1 dephospho-CoA kinase [Aliarcobacter butzleri L348]KLD99119.1 dephospho-CoA kinase [Aliarcobacter butzleri L349]
MSNDLFKNAIALTGGISTGKSTVCNLLKLHGFLTIDADKIAHKLLDENSSKIEEMFGKEYVENGKVLRKELGKIIFSNEENKLKLEALLHPLIKEEIIKESKIYEEQNKPYFVDIPLFFEKMHYPISKSLVIYTPKELQIQRLMKRDNIDEKEAKLKISNQMDIEEKRKLANIVIDNSKDLKHLQNEVERVIGEII